MKYLIWAFLSVIVLTPTQSKSCDACACSINFSDMGYSGTFSGSFLSMHYGAANTRITLFDRPPIFDQYKTLQIQGRIHLGRGLFSRINIPIHENVREDGMTVDKVTGYGDPVVGLTYQFLNRAFVYLEGGFDLGLPFGKFDETLFWRQLPEHFNPGYGQFAIGLNTQATFRSGNNGVYLAARSTHFIPHSSGYNFGSQSTLIGQCYKGIDLKANKQVIPALGCWIEKAGADRYFNGTVKQGTGSSLVAGLVALTYSAPRWNAGAQFFLPILYGYEDEAIVPRSRFSIRFNYRLNTISNSKKSKIQK